MDNLVAKVLDGTIKPTLISENSGSKQSIGWAVVSVTCNGLEVGKRYLIVESNTQYGVNPSNIAQEFSYLSDKIGVTIGTATATSTTVSSSMYGDAWRTLRVFEI